MRITSKHALLFPFIVVLAGCLGGAGRNSSDDPAFLAEAEIKTLQTAMKGASRSLNSAMSMVQTTRIERDNLRAELEELGRNHEAALADIEDLEEQLDEIQDELKELRRLKRLEDSRDSIEARLKDVLQKPVSRKKVALDFSGENPTVIFLIRVQGKDGLSLSDEFIEYVRLIDNALKGEFFSRIRVVSLTRSAKTSPGEWQSTALQSVLVATWLDAQTGLRGSLLEPGAALRSTASAKAASLRIEIVPDELES